jgi:Fe-S cluster assembly protein SufD
VQETENAPAWWQIPVQTRNERFTSGNPADYPTPSPIQAEWKFSPIDLLNPLLEAKTTDTYEFKVTGATAEWADSKAYRGHAGIPEEIFSAKAWESTTKSLVLEIAGEGEPVFLSRTIEGQIAAHTVIIAKPNSKRTVIIRNSGTGSIIENLEVVVSDGASLNLVHLNDFAGTAIQLASHFSKLEKSAELNYFHLNLGGKIVRVNPNIYLDGEHSTGRAYGASLVNPGEFLENRVFIHHHGKKATSDVLFKNVLLGDGSRSVWVGDVLIGPGASGTNSYEANRNLLLSDKARADSIPNLEIETGDIEGAGHASATGRLDDEQLFYLQSRGIGEIEARRLVSLGFLVEILGKIGQPEFETEIEYRFAEILDGEPK